MKSSRERRLPLAVPPHHYLFVIERHSTSFIIDISVVQNAYLEHHHQKSLNFLLFSLLAWIGSGITGRGHTRWLDLCKTSQHRWTGAAQLNLLYFVLMQ